MHVVGSARPQSRVGPGCARHIHMHMHVCTHIHALAQAAHDKRTLNEQLHDLIRKYHGAENALAHANGEVDFATRVVERVTSESLHMAKSALDKADQKVKLTRHPSPGTRHPLHPSPFTLHPSPSTLHPSPSTLHPSPSTLRPPPFALHPSPSTLHPPPSTLHPHLSPLTPHLSPLTSHLSPSPLTLTLTSHPHPHLRWSRPSSTRGLSAKCSSSRLWDPFALSALTSRRPSQD